MAPNSSVATASCLRLCLFEQEDGRGGAEVFQQRQHSVTVGRQKDLAEDAGVLLGGKAAKILDRQQVDIRRVVPLVGQVAGPRHGAAQQIPQHR